MTDLKINMTMKKDNEKKIHSSTTIICNDNDVLLQQYFLELGNRMPKLCINDFRTLSDNSSAKSLHDNEYFPIVLLASRQGFINTAVRKNLILINGETCK